MSRIQLHHITRADAEYQHKLAVNAELGASTAVRDGERCSNVVT